MPASDAAATMLPSSLAGVMEELGYSSGASAASAASVIRAVVAGGSSSSSSSSSPPTSAATKLDAASAAAVLAMLARTSGGRLASPPAESLASLSAAIGGLALDGGGASGASPSPSSVPRSWDGPAVGAALAAANPALDWRAVAQALAGVPGAAVPDAQALATLLGAWRAGAEASSSSSSGRGASSAAAAAAAPARFPLDAVLCRTWASPTGQADFLREALAADAALLSFEGVETRAAGASACAPAAAAAAVEVPLGVAPPPATAGVGCGAVYEALVRLVRDESGGGGGGGGAPSSLPATSLSTGPAPVARAALAPSLRAFPGVVAAGLLEAGAAETQLAADLGRAAAALAAGGGGSGGGPSPSAAAAGAAAAPKALAPNPSALADLASRSPEARLALLTSLAAASAEDGGPVASSRVAEAVRAIFGSEGGADQAALAAALDGVAADAVAAELAAALGRASAAAASAGASSSSSLTPPPPAFDAEAYAAKRASRSGSEGFALPPPTVVASGAAAPTPPASADGGGPIAAAAAAAATAFPADVEAEANAAFQALYAGDKGKASSGSGGGGGDDKAAAKAAGAIDARRPLTVDALATRMLGWAAGGARDRALSACMAAALLDEYRFFGRYPEPELAKTAALLGALVSRGLLPDAQLALALRCVLDAAREPPGSKLARFFAAGALRACAGQLHRFPKYCAQLAALQGLRDADRALAATVDAVVADAASGRAPPQPAELGPAAARQQAAASASASADGGGPSAQQEAAAAAAAASAAAAAVTGTLGLGAGGSVEGGIAGLASPPTSTSSSRGAGVGAGGAGAPAAGTPGASLANRDPARAFQALNAETLEAAAASGEGQPGPPPDSIADRVAFVINNLSVSNVDERARELAALLEAEHRPWFAHYLVAKRAAQEPNYHALYARLVEAMAEAAKESGDAAGGRGIWHLLTAATHKYVRALLASERAVTQSGERSLLKNLGSWLGRLTIARERPILARDLDVRSTVLDAYARGKMIAVLPFVHKVLEPCRDSRVFRPATNPWVSAVLSVVAEVYGCERLKLNLKFEIEMMFRSLGVSLDAAKPSDVLGDVPRIPGPSADFSEPRPAAAAGSAGERKELRPLPLRPPRRRPPPPRPPRPLPPPTLLRAAAAAASSTTCTPTSRSRPRRRWAASPSARSCAA
jgi:CCR4-NOT transcription complex subunit 1